MWAIFFAALWFIVKWTLILMWRFFSGNYLDGQPRNDATWWKDASRKYQKVRRKYTWWVRKCRMKRAAWRNAIFWPCLILSVGFAVDPVGMGFVVGMLSPGLYFFGHRRVRLWFYLPVAGTHSDGSVHQHWVMKPSVRRLVDKFRPDRLRLYRRHPGLLPDPEKRTGPTLADIPLDYADAVRAEVIERVDDSPPITLKLLLDPEVDMIEP